MDHEEHVLNLSDVVHDVETIDDDPPNNGSTAESHSVSRPSEYDPSSSILPLHDNYGDPEHSAHHMSPADSYSVEMLEREIATLLNQNASAASAALLSAAAQQRQAGLVLGNELLDGGPVSESMASLGIGLSGLAAVLHAVHTQGLTSQATSQADMPQKEQPTTRTAPDFHSLTTGEVSEGQSGKRRRTDGRSGSEASDYLFSEREDYSDREGYVNADSGMRHSSPPHPQPDAESHLTNGLPDINDILTHFSAQFEHDPNRETDHDLSPHDSPPVIAHEQSVINSELPIVRSSAPPIPVLAPSNRTSAQQPVASTSYLAPMAQAPPKRRKNQAKNSTHVCEEEHCQKSFTRRSDLARHMRIHTGERPFMCSFDGCGKTFIQRSALHVHSRVHTGEKPHCCEYPGCGKTFGDSSSLARHRRTHTGKRPYKCEDPSCEKTFTRRTTLTTHMRTHDPSWEPDPNVKYSFKGKKRKVTEDDDDRELVESVRTISALLQAGTSMGVSVPDEPLEMRVASISAEIAAAIAQAQSRVYEDEEEEEESGSGHEMGGLESIGPNTSGIRGEGLSDPMGVEDQQIGGPGDDGDDSDAFPAPLRARKQMALLGNKRKR